MDVFNALNVMENDLFLKDLARGCPVVGQPQPVHAKAEAARNRVGVSTARDGVCVYRLRRLVHFCRCFRRLALRFALSNEPPRRAGGHERASSARLEGWLEEWHQCSLIPGRLEFFASDFTGPLAPGCGALSTLSGVQDRPYSSF